MKWMLFVFGFWISAIIIRTVLYRNFRETERSNAAFHSGAGCVQQGENAMKGLVSILALAIGLAFTLPAFAGDVAIAKTEADCKKAGGSGMLRPITCAERCNDFLTWGRRLRVGKPSPSALGRYFHSRQPRSRLWLMQASGPTWPSSSPPNTESGAPQGCELLLKGMSNSNRG